MILTDYDEKFHMQTVRKEGYEEGIKRGFEDGDTHRLKVLIQKKLQKGYTIPQIADLLEEEQALIEQLAAELKHHEEQP